MQRTEPLSLSEFLLVATVLAFGSWSVQFWGDWSEQTYIRSLWVFVPARFALTAAAFWLSGYLIGGSRVVRLPAALWGAIGWNVLFFSMLPYVGFILLPVEIVIAGLLFSFRSSLATWKAVIISGIVRGIVLIAIHPVYILELVT